MNRPTCAFVLGAGLGTRLRPLTDLVPKPLVPVFNKPLATFALDHLHAAGIERFVINTHHRPEAYSNQLGMWEGRSIYRGCPVAFRHEPTLLETGGGIRNVRDLLGDEHFLVYNGDVLADFPLEPLIEAHCRSQSIATLALRPDGAAKRVQCDPATGRITDLRGLLGGRTEPSFVFTGVSVFSPQIHRHIPPREPVSIIPVLADLLLQGAPIGGVVLESGLWFDIGTPEAYLEIHRLLAGGHHTFSYLPGDWLRPTSPHAVIASGAQLSGCTTVGPGVTVPSSAKLHDTIVWENTLVQADSHLSHAIISPAFFHQCAPPDMDQSTGSEPTRYT